MPLAGPDLATERWGLRPLYRMRNGDSILRNALKSRCWAREESGGNYTFVVREVAGIEALTDYLRSEWPGCAIVTLSRVTDGALFSALAGVALAKHDQTICIDLADIIFDGPQDLSIEWSGSVGAIVPCFSSDDPSFSYIGFSEIGKVCVAAEKRVISRHASAGVYMFRDSAVFLEAAAHSLRNRDAMAYRGLFFVCPSMNGVLAQGLEVRAPFVQNARAIGKMFHSDGLVLEERGIQ